MTTDELPKILVVDDSPQISKALSDLLGASGYSVRTAPSGERALQIMETSMFDLVLTDLKMTGMSGIDLAKKVMERLPGVPVVILTGFGDMDSVINALRLGVADYLKKPFSMDEVLSVVQRELTKGHAQRAAAALETKAPEKPPRVYIFNQKDLEQIETVLSRLRAQATAESALLVEQAGYVIAAKGMSGGVEVEPLSDLIAGSRATSASLASLLGEEQDFSTNYMEGQRVSVYTTVLGRGLYLAVIVPKGTKQGLVWLYAKEAAVEIDRIVRRATDAIQEQLGHIVGDQDREALRKELAARNVENVFEQKRSVPPLPKLDRTPPPSNVSTISFRKDQVEPEVTTGAFRQVAPPPPQEEKPPVEEDTEPITAVSFEEAMKMGLLGSLVPSEPLPTAPEPEVPTANLAPDKVDAVFDNPIGNEAASPAEPSAEAPSAEESLTPDKFEEALRKGLLKFD
jgi:DNA-binding response OmpR family regulator